MNLFKDFEEINTLVDFDIFKNQLIINKKRIITVSIDNKEVIEKSDAYLLKVDNVNEDFFYIKKTRVFITLKILLLKEKHYKTLFLIQRLLAEGIGSFEL